MINKKLLMSALILAGLLVLTAGCGKKDVLPEPASAEKAVGDSAGNEADELIPEDDPAEEAGNEANEAAEPDESAPELIEIEPDTDPAILDATQWLCGTWADSNSGRAYMTIETVEGEPGSFNVLIEWADGAVNSYQWGFTGIYDPESSRLNYSSCTYTNVTYNEDGTTSDNTFIIEDGSGYLLAEDDHILWHDDLEDAGGDCVFVKETGEEGPAR